MKKVITLVLVLSTIWTECSFAQDFTIGVIPDWQKLTYLGTDGAQQMKNITQWFVDHKQELNIVFVASLGDMSQGTYNATDYSADQWNRNTAALSILRNAGIPFSPNQGNHDPYVAINKYFPVSYFENEPYWGGSMNGKIENAYYLFETSGMKFILLNTQWAKSSSVNSWANDIFKENSGRRGIFVNHSGLCKVNDNEYLVDPVVRKNDNIFLATSGHLCEYDGEEFNKYTSIGGKTQYCIRTDYQCRGTDASPAAMLRFYTFKPNKDSVYAYTLDVWKMSYETDASSQFAFHYIMDDCPDVTVTGVSVSPTSSFIYIGSRKELIPAVLPTNATNRSVRWTSDNKSVATVDSRGIVTALKEGTAVITAATMDGGFTANSIVTILPVPVIHVTGIQVFWPVVNLSVRGKQQLTVILSPTNATNKSVSWSSNDTSVATVDFNGLVTAIAAGKATITITTNDGKITATSVVTVTDFTAIHDLDSIPAKQLVSIYPNPINQDKLTIKSEGLKDLDNVEVIITNLQGKMVYQNSLPGNKTIEIYTSGLLKNSIYFVSVRSGQTITNSKLIVQER